MANHDHNDNIGTHPAYSLDPETRLRARLDAATQKRTQAEKDYTTARNNLRVFLAAKDAAAAEPVPEVYTVKDEFVSVGSGWWASEPTLDPDTAAWDYYDDLHSPRGEHGLPRFVLSDLADLFKRVAV